MKAKAQEPPKPWKPSARVRAFLAAYRKLPMIAGAARAAKIRREAHYRLLERSPHYKALFARADLEAGEVLKDEAVRRAVAGVARPLFYHGKRVKGQVVREYSDQLLLALLKARYPREFRERVEHGLDEAAQGSANKFTGTMQELLELYRGLVATKA